MSLKDIDVLNESVIQSGYCIGCGVCAAVPESPIVMQLNDRGQYQASLSKMTGGNLDYSYLKICPFSGVSENESELASLIFNGKQYQQSEFIGKYLECFAGHVMEGSFRNSGSSGGIGKWLLSELLAKGEVDYVIQVGSTLPKNTDDSLTYRYRVYTEADQILSGSKSAYQTVEMSEILGKIREKKGRYAVTAIPCFTKALRLLMKADPVFTDRILYIIGMFCGHMKSTRYGEFLAWQLSVPPGELGAIDFRVKQEGHRANDKAIEAKAIDGSKIVKKLTKKLQGGDYNLGFFQYQACDYCDDVVSELADASIGDAWLPQYIDDNRGTSIVVVRNRKLLQLIEDAVSKGRLQLDRISESTVIKSQAGGFRQRREGLAYRLDVAKKEKQWVPRKRVLPNSTHIDRRRRRVYSLRTQLWKKSHELYSDARKTKELQSFTVPMEKLVRQYLLANRPSFMTRLVNKLNRFMKRS